MNILIVGLGSIARKHINALNLLDFDKRIYALRSSIRANREEQIINIYDLDQCDVAFDFAIISNPTNLHYSFIKILLKRGIPLFIEKPVIHDLSVADELIGLAEETRIVTYVACNLRFHPCIKFLKERFEVELPNFNELNVYCGSFLPDWRQGKDFREFYSVHSSMGGGVHLDLIHELDYTTWLFGFPVRSRSLLKSASTLNIETVDYANYIFEYQTFTANIILNYYRKRPKREIDIVFEDNSWKVDLLKAEIRDDKDEVIFQDLNFNMNATYVSQLEYFIDCLNSRSEPMNGLKDSINVLKICLGHD